MKRGWAIANHAGIDIRTVSETQRAAKVNWLALHCGWWAQKDDTDDRIEERWNDLKMDAQVVKVKVEIDQEA